MVNAPTVQGLCQFGGFDMWLQDARHAIGTGVIGGMLVATVLGVRLIPVFFVVVRRMLGDKLDDVPEGRS